MIRSTHSLRAVAAAAAAFLLASSFAPAGAQTTPQPITPAAPASPATPAPDMGSTVSPVIHPGDQLAISVFDEPPLPPFVVQADGTIQYPLAGRILVGGLTPSEARDAVTHALKKYMKHPSVTVAVAQQGQMGVLVYGNVKNTGKFLLRSGARLSDAVAAAGGVAMFNAEYPTARVSELDGTMTVASLDKLLRQGDATQNLPLEDNSIVYVNGGETIRVQVIGAVSRPGNVEVNVGDRLTMALARSGAEAAAHSDLNRVYLTRIDPATGKTLPSYEINVYQALERGDQRYDPILRKDDKIYVPEARSISAGSMGLLGLLGRLLRF